MRKKKKAGFKKNNITTMFFDNGEREFIFDQKEIPAYLKLNAINA